MSSNKLYTVLKWIIKILAAALTVFGLLFYFGYGNPLPFIDAGYTAWDNLWLSVFPIMFLGLIIGLLFEKAGGYIVVVSVAAGLITGLLLTGSFVWYMLVPFVFGILYLVIGYSIKKYAKIPQK
jgi:hypothetical protein